MFARLNGLIQRGSVCLLCNASCQGAVRIPGTPMCLVHTKVHKHGQVRVMWQGAHESTLWHSHAPCMPPPCSGQLHLHLHKAQSPWNPNTQPHTRTQHTHAHTHTHTHTHAHTHTYAHTHTHTHTHIRTSRSLQTAPLLQGVTRRKRVRSIVSTAAAVIAAATAADAASRGPASAQRPAGAPQQPAGACTGGAACAFDTSCLPASCFAFCFCL